MNSIGEGMVDIGSNPTGDSRVVQIKRAAANFIDMIEQMEVQPTGRDVESLRKQAQQHIANACGLAVQAANMRAPIKSIPPEPDQPGHPDYDAATASRNERETSDDTPQGAPV